jgi:hypothetical protein
MTMGGFGANLSGTYTNISTFEPGTGFPKLGTLTRAAADITLESAKTAVTLLKRKEENILAD